MRAPSLTRAAHSDGPPSFRASTACALQLPLDHHPTPCAEKRLGSHSFRLPSLPARAAVGLDVLLAAAFGAQLARYGGQPSIALVVSRVTAQGRLAWTRPTALTTDANTPFRAVLEQAAQFLRNPASDAVVPEGGNRAKLTFVEGSGADLDVVAVLERSGELLDADLHLVVGKARRDLRAVFVYDASLFERASIERFAGHLRALLRGAVADLDRSIAALPLLAPEEQRWLDAVCVGRPRPPIEDRVHQRVERHAATSPQAVALQHRDATLDYQGLNGRANQLARHLAARGAGTGSHIVVCLEPGLEIAVALLATLKVGAVYVPLDPTYPAARITAILEDTRPALVVTHSALVDRLGLERQPTLCLDAAGSLLDAQSTDDLRLAVDPTHAASIFYTSGTTGRPKGVVATHGNVSAYIQSAIDRYGFTADDVMPAIARFSFSISMLELMMPLVAGGTLRILDRDHVVDPARMARTLRSVTFFHAGPSLLKGLTAYILREAPDPSLYAGVRHASSGGDMVPPEVLESLKSIFSRAEVFVIYGCSEISCMGVTWPVPRDRVVDRTFVGRPFDGVKVRVLDAARAQVPAGVVGEIHFAGDGITRGYLDRDELTAEKFIEVDGERYYRTGDLGRVSEDGWLEILGRSDYQVKIRGMRVELAEIEHHLRRAPGARDGVVMARENAGDAGEKALVGYVVPEDQDEAGWPARVAAIRAHIAEHLPDYMVPSTYVKLASLPLNHNMKVDRNALPAPAQSDRRRSAARIRPPETDTQERLAAIWKKLLGVDAVGLDDNFFDLGGHSILAVELVIDVESALGIELEGMTVLRESLEVQAAICEQRIASAIPTSNQRLRMPAAVTTDIFHFGAGHDLYGVLHRSSDAEARPEAVLICSPIGQEQTRADFVLQRFARGLAVRGVPVMRFDWFGTRDSLGETVEATCGRWERDIEEAVAELQRRTGAKRISVVGARLGATLLWRAARHLDLARIVLWDPVLSGAAHHAAMVALHADYLRSVRHLRLWRRSKALPGAEQMLGTTWSHAALAELDALTIDAGAGSPSCPVGLLATSGVRHRDGDPSVSRIGATHRARHLEIDCRWSELAAMEDVLPDLGITAALTALVAEDP